MTNPSSVNAAPIRWGILGTANIATKIANAIHESTENELVAIGSRSLEAAQKWASEHQAKNAYGSYAEVLEDPDVDAIYIPLPPSMHAEWTIAAANAGKHVLCEKPLVAELADAEKMLAACRENNVQLMDGVMWVHHPRSAMIRKMLDENNMGDVKRITSAFSFFGDKMSPDDLRFKRELGGGSLLDLGWYTVGHAIWVYRCMPEKVWATATFRDDTDMNISAQMWFPDGKIASFDCGFDKAYRLWFEIAGETGTIVCDDFTLPTENQVPRFWSHDRQGNGTEHLAPDENQVVHMLDDFAGMIRGGELVTHWIEHSVQVQTICDALDRSARAGGEIIEL